MAERLGMPKFGLLDAKPEPASNADEDAAEAGVTDIRAKLKAVPFNAGA